MMHYFLTGSEASREAVVQLARYVIDIDDGRRTVFAGSICRSRQVWPRCLREGTTVPGAAPANSLNALMDGHRCQWQPRVLRQSGGVSSAKHPSC